MQNRSLFMLSLQEPIGVIMAALAEKMSMELQLSTMHAQTFAEKYAQFSYVPMLNEILNDIFTQENVEQGLQRKMIDPSRHLVSLGFDQYHAEAIVARTTKMAIMIIASFVPNHVMNRTDNQWSMVEPFDLWLYTYEPQNEDSSDTGHQTTGADTVLSGGIGQHS